MAYSLESLDKKAEQVKLYADQSLSKKFTIPVLMQDEVARVIATSLLLKGADTKLWLNGSLVNLKDVNLEIVLNYPQNQERI